SKLASSPKNEYLNFNIAFLRDYLLSLTCDYLFKVFSVTVFERASEVKIIFLIVMWDVIRMASLMFMVTPYVCSGIDR
ncbi:hypothetical protein, partial [Escherichia coli]|uniref:hypothetical protein n=1 Tax=Escherichia coli TaxID=562 RepID=UPI001BAE8AB9